MMTEQELNNLIRGKAQTNIPSVIKEIMRLTQSLDEKARELASLHHAATTENGEAGARP